MKESEELNKATIYVLPKMGNNLKANKYYKLI